MKKPLILLFTMIIVLSLLKIAAAIPVVYDFTNPVTSADTSFTFPGTPSVTVYADSNNATPPNPLVHQCPYGLGVISDSYTHTNGNSPNTYEDNHTVDEWIGTQNTKKLSMERLIFTCGDIGDLVTINWITFTRVDGFDHFSLFVDGVHEGDFHITDFINYTPTFEDFVVVNFSTDYTGRIFEIGTAASDANDDCDDFKVAGMGGGDPVPEPGTIFLLFFGLLGMIGFNKKFNKI